MISAKSFVLNCYVLHGSFRSITGRPLAKIDRYNLGEQRRQLLSYSYWWRV